MTRTLIVLCLIVSLSAAEPLLIPIDPQQYQTLAETIAHEAEDGNNAAVLRDGRRALELAPNDPEMQAPIYMFMSIAAKSLGEVAKAEDFVAIARILDPAIDSRLSKGGKGVVTRGDVVATVGIITQVAGQIVGTIQQIRLMKTCLEMVKHGMTPLPACGQGQQGVQQPVYGQGVSYPGQSNPYGQPGLTVQAGAGVVYPTTPVTSPSYQAPVTPAAPVTGWPAQPGGQPQTVAGAQPAPAQPQPASTVQPTPIQSQPAAATQIVSPAPLATAVAQATPAPPVATATAQVVATQTTPVQPNVADPQQPTQITGQTNVSKAQGNFYLSSGSYTFVSPAGPAPYATTQARSRPEIMRGEETAVFKVIHDHSNMASKAYFEQSCGALLGVSGTDLTFTASGGEGAFVIPAAEIMDLRVNSLLGKETGGFHVATRKGLYLSLAPESLEREQARAMVETIRTRLGLSE